MSDQVAPCNCALCGFQLAPSRAKAWTSKHQVLALEDNSTDLVQPSEGFPVAENHCVVLHVGCWHVLDTLLRPRKIDSAMVERLTQCIRAVAPCFERLPSPRNNPAILDHAIHMADEDSRDAPIQVYGSGLNYNCFGLPADVIQLIYEAIDCYEDILNLQEVTRTSPHTGIWLSLGRKYRVFEVINAGSMKEVATKIQRVLWKVHRFPSRWPHAVNYSMLWQNAIDVVSRLDDEPLGSDPINQLDVPLPKSHRRLGRRIGATTKLTPPVNNASAAYLRFSRIGKGHYLAGITFDGATVGYRGDYSTPLRAEPICGLRWCSPKGGSISSVQAKHRSGWEGNWHGTYPATSDNNIYMQLEWDSGGDGRLLVSLDAAHIRLISYTGSSPHLRCGPLAWRSSIPSDVLQPVSLYDKLPAPRPLSFFEDEGLGSVTAISLSVCPIELSIYGIEFVGKATYSESGASSRVCQLAFYLEEGERFVGLAHAEVQRLGQSELILQFATSRGRRVIFGAEENVTEWLSSPAPDGIFISICNITGCLTNFGVLSNRHKQITPSIPPATDNHQVTQWKSGTVTLNLNSQPRKTSVFVSEADLTSASGIIVYEKFGDRISGIQIFYADRTARPPELLGQVWRVKKSFSILGELTSICVHYKQVPIHQFAVVGLYFQTTSNQCIEVGDVLAVPQRHLQLSDGQRVLSWLFGKWVDYLSLSEHHVTDTITDTVSGSSTSDP